jgi:hypothetical protein
MKTNANNTARLEPSTHTADLAERVRMNQAKLPRGLDVAADIIERALVGG